MGDIRLVKASLQIAYEEGDSENKEFIKEYYGLIQLNNDPLGIWLRSPQIRKASDESDQVLLTLLVELHHKIDTLTQMIKSPEPLHILLKGEGNLQAIGHGYFQFEKAVLQKGKTYYGRIDMPIFPRRQMPLFFEAMSEDMGKIILMHEDDEQDWSSYMVACERVMIRQMKGHSSEY